MRRVNRIAFILIMLTFIISFFIIPKSKDMYNINLFDDNVTKYDKGWHLIEDGIASRAILPSEQIDSNNTLIIRNKLSDSLPEGMSILLRSYMQSVTILVDGEVRYEVGTDTSRFTGHDFGVYYACADLSYKDAGKDIEIHLFSHQKLFNGKVPEIYIGTKSSLFHMIFNERPMWNLLSILMLVIGILIMMFYLACVFFKVNNHSSFYLACYTIILGNWFLGQSRILQFFIDNPYYITRISYLMNLLCPLAIGLYIEDAVPIKNNIGIRIHNTIIMINAYILYLLEIFDIVDLSSSLFVICILIVSGCIYFIIKLYIEGYCNNNEKAKRELRAILIFFLFVIFEIITFFINGQQEISWYMLIGASIYISILIIYALISVRDTQKLEMEKKYFEKLAYNDALTNALNRTAYNEKIDSILTPENYSVIQIDTDGLKYINDECGHHAGDQVIIDTYNAINYGFGDIGSIFRVGGDEFTCIIENQSDAIIFKSMKKLYNKVEEINAKCDYNFSVSIGIAHYDSILDNNLRHTVFRADYNMYEDKKRLKNKQ